MGLIAEIEMRNKQFATPIPIGTCRKNWGALLLYLFIGRRSCCSFRLALDSSSNGSVRYRDGRTRGWIIEPLWPLYHTTAIDVIVTAGLWHWLSCVSFSTRPDSNSIRFIANQERQFGRKATYVEFSGCRRHVPSHCNDSRAIAVDKSRSQLFFPSLFW